MEMQQENLEMYEEQFKEYVDTETGECIEGIITPKDEVLESIEAEIRKEKRARYYRNKTEFESYLQCNFGSFYFNNYMELWKKLTKENSALAFRFLYLCTYADFDGYLKFGGTRRGVDTSYMTLKDFKEVFNVSDGMTTKLKNELFDNELIFQTDDKRLMVNDKYYTRGKLSSTDKRKSTRSFDYGIREIYKKSKPTEHKRLGLIIPLLDYVNVHLNIICQNVNEKEPKYMYPLTMEEICDVVGYDYTHSTKLRKTLSKITVNGQPMVAYMSHQGADFFVINPAIFYKGKKLDELKTLVNLFKVNNYSR